MWPDDREKITQFLGKEAQRVTQLKNAKMSAAKLNLKAQHFYINILLNLLILVIILKKNNYVEVAQNVAIFGATSSYQKIQQAFQKVAQ